MATPQQKSLELESAITRVVPPWKTPDWLGAEQWRRAVRAQPVAIVCREKLVNHLQVSDWEVIATDPEEQDTLAFEVDYYTDVLNGKWDGVEFDTLWELMWQDILDLPIGGNMEIVRWPLGQGPISRPNPKGHPYKLVFVDGATLKPTYDPVWFMAQQIRGVVSKPRVVLFNKQEMARIVLTARPEIGRKGYGMPPPEKVYLALSLLYRGDTYYANLLLDTPEAGVLDLMDMTQKDAREWVSKFSTLLSGIDPFKIAVGYQHDKPWQWLPFGRPPTELMFSDVTLKYSRVMAAGYWLTLSDIGLEPRGSKTLAGEIRSERAAKQSGFGMVKERTKNFINIHILPEWLTFVWKDRDPEEQILRYRAFNLGSSAIQRAVDTGLMTKTEGQQQLVSDGLITVTVKPPDETEALLPAFEIGATPEAEKTPPAEGGRGEVVTQADVDPAEFQNPANWSLVQQMQAVLTGAFSSLLSTIQDAHLIKLIKVAARELGPMVEQAIAVLDDLEIKCWLSQRAAMWLDLPSEFDDIAIVQQSKRDIAKLLEDIMRQEGWWQLDEAILTNLSVLMEMAFVKGLEEGAYVLQQYLYTEGLVDSPDLGITFALKDEETKDAIGARASTLLDIIDAGTAFFIARTIVAITEAKMTAIGGSIEDFLENSNLLSTVASEIKTALNQVFARRSESIAGQEVAHELNKGKLEQWTQAGLKTKSWITHPGHSKTGPCEICLANEALGPVPLDHMYDSQYGAATLLGPLAHWPGYCTLDFDKNEAKMVQLEFWPGDKLG